MQKEMKRKHEQQQFLKNLFHLVDFTRSSVVGVISGVSKKENS